MKAGIYMQFMLKTVLGVAIVTIISVLSGCSSVKTKIVDKENGEKIAVAMAKTPSDAYSGAVDEAKSHCEKQSKNFLLVSHRSEYQGMDPQARVQIDTVRTVASALTGYKGRHAGSTVRDDDFKETVVFRCK